MTPIVLHIGSTKTGTSSLQRYFADQSSQLLDQGVCYPAAGRRGPGLLAHHNLCYEKQSGRVRSGVFRPAVGTWDEAAGGWTELPGASKRRIELAMEMASRMRPVELIDLPLGRIGQ